MLSPAEIISWLRGYRYLCGSEIALQAGIERVLDENKVRFLREHNLGRDYGRIDFYLPHVRIGMELKVKGSRSQVIRQLYRYAKSPDIAALILVTGKAGLSATPAELNGKPLWSECLWQGLLS